MEMRTESQQRTTQSPTSQRNYFMNNMRMNDTISLPYQRKSSHGEAQYTAHTHGPTPRRPTTQQRLREIPEMTLCQRRLSVAC